MDHIGRKIDVGRSGCSLDRLWPGGRGFLAPGLKSCMDSRLGTRTRVTVDGRSWWSG